MSERRRKLVPSAAVNESPHWATNNARSPTFYMLLHHVILRLLLEDFIADNLKKRGRRIITSYQFLVRHTPYKKLL